MQGLEAKPAAVSLWDKMEEQTPPPLEMGLVFPEQEVITAGAKQVLESYHLVNTSLQSRAASREHPPHVWVCLTLDKVACYCLTEEPSAVTAQRTNVDDGHVVSQGSSEVVAFLTLEGTAEPKLCELRNTRLSTRSKLSFFCPQKCWSCGSRAILLGLQAHGTPS